MPPFKEGRNRQETGQPRVTVTEIPLDRAKPPILDLYDADSHGPPADREDALAQGKRMSEAAHALRGPLKKAYKLTWEGGDATPRDVVVGGHTIMQLRAGEVMNEMGENIGTYERWTKQGDNYKGGTRYEVNVFLYADPK